MNPSSLAKFDLVVLGGGPAGTSGAAAAGLLGKRVALVEKAALVGGAGINTGTIPSKTLRETSLMLSGWRSRKLFGVDLSLRREATVADFMRHSDDVSAASRGQISSRMELLGVERIRGAARFTGPRTIEVARHDGGADRLEADKILIAT